MFYYRVEMEDRLSEDFDYCDQGCELYPSCLNCPLPRCRYDQGGKRAKKELRDEEVVMLREEGVSVKELAGRFGVSKRTVHRILRRSHGD